MDIPTKCKSRVQTAFVHFKNTTDTYFDRKRRCFLTNGDTEFKPLHSLFSLSRITLVISSPYTHKQHGYFERMYRHIVDMGFTFFANASIPMKSWFDVSEPATVLINHLPSKVVGFNSL